MKSREETIAQCRVGYLSDTAQIVDGIDFDYDLQTAILNAPEGQFTPLGRVACELLGTEIFIGIKKRGDERRALREIAIAETLIRANPELRSALPLFAACATSFDNPIGVLTEDFSEGGLVKVEEDKHRVRPFTPPWDLPTEFHKRVSEALGGIFCAEAFGHMSAVLEDKTVLVDFDDIAYLEDLKVMEEVLVYAELANAVVI